MTDPITSVCQDVVVDLDTLLALIPGGIRLQGISQQDIGTAMGKVRALLAQANTALAPLQPIFNIIQCFIDAVEVFKAVPDPVAVAEKLVQLEQDLSKLLGLVPAASVPLLVYSMIKLIVASLNAVLAKLEVLAANLAEINSTGARVDFLQNLPNGAGVYAAGQLEAASACAMNTYEAQLAGLQDSLGPLNELISLINQLLHLIDLPCIDPVADLPGIEAAIGLLEDFLLALPQLPIPPPFKC